MLTSLGWVLMTAAVSGAPIEKEPFVPVIEVGGWTAGSRLRGDWWSVASTPKLPDAYQNDKQEPVDFAVWQAADGTWQLWSCIRNTRCGGHTRLFYGWEAKSLLDSDWTPKGIQMESRPGLGEAPGGLQAPHVIKTDGRYVGGWTAGSRLRECPHVVEVSPGEFVYFRNQYYGAGAANWAYYSTNPLNFGIDDDTNLVAQLPIAAPEIVLYDGKYYIAALKPELNGIRIARLSFHRSRGLGGG